MHKLLVSIAFLLLVSAGAALAQGVRQLPMKGERGQLGDPQPLPMVLVNGKSLRLAPGGIVFDRHNRTVVHASLPAKADVFFTKDMNGDIQRMYILTPDESTLLDQSPRK
jgi:hypothetical protein